MQACEEVHSNWDGCMPYTYKIQHALSMAQYDPLWCKSTQYNPLRYKQHECQPLLTVFCASRAAYMSDSATTVDWLQDVHVHGVVILLAQLI